MKTLLKNSSNDKWGPVFVEDIRKAICINMDYSIEKNIAYNMQYLQYISKQIDELRLTSVLQKMLYKTYIVTGMSILEAVFYCLLKERNLLTTDCWKTEKKYITNEAGPDNNRTRIVNELQKKSEPYEVKHNLDSLISKVKSKKIFSTDNLTYEILENYRKLRNKIHIYICDDSSDSDYNSFNKKDYVMMKMILKMLLSDDAVTNKKYRKNLDLIFGNLKSELEQEFKNQA